MIDLHTHTRCSDGTLTPRELIDAALALNLEALAITDHDTLSAYDEVADYAGSRGLELVCGIELSAKHSGRSIHILGYFPGASPDAPFREWITQLQTSRHERNRALVQNLNAIGVAITLEEVQAEAGAMPGRPHFARVLQQKGYVGSLQEAFDVYLSEAARCYATRVEPTLADCIEQIGAAGGISSIAHPVRYGFDFAELEALTAAMAPLGLRALEVFHSTHSPDDRQRLTQLAERFGLTVTGGSDFHGDIKPDVALGSGINGNVAVPHSVLANLRQLA